RRLVTTDNGRAVVVMTAAVRENPAAGRYARPPAEGFAVEPDLADPTGVLAAAFGDLASPLSAGGVLRGIGVSDIAVSQHLRLGVEAGAGHPRRAKTCQSADEG